MQTTSPRQPPSVRAVHLMTGFACRVSWPRSRRGRHAGWLVATLLGFTALAGGSSRQAPKISVRFHAETTALDTGTFSMPVSLLDGDAAPRQLYVERIPSISDRDIVAFYPFPARQGGSYGVQFQLNRHGQLTLQSLSTSKIGSSILVMINGRPVTPLTVDRPITDGLIVVPFGVSTVDVQSLDQTFPRIGQAPGSKPARGPRRED